MRRIFSIVALVIVAFLILIVLLYLGLLQFLHSSEQQAKNNRAQAVQALENNQNTLIDQFNAMNIITGEDSVMAVDAQIDTSASEANLLGIPTLEAVKHYFPNQTAGSVYDNFQSVLTKNGFQEDSDASSGEQPCVSGINDTYGNDYYYTKGTSSIDINLTCASTATDSSSWRSINIPTLDEKLQITAY